MDSPIISCFFLEGEHFEMSGQRITSCLDKPAVFAQCATRAEVVDGNPLGADSLVL
jgi:hypothetical protein